MKFTEFNLSSEIQKGLAEKGFVDASPIQEKAIPLALNNKDIIGQAQTGTGKTAAFGVPIVEMVEVENRKLQHLIVAPTRELAGQITQELSIFAKYKKVNVVEIFGGVSYERQRKALSNSPHIVVATPGRLIDLIKQNKIKLQNLKSFTLDEADEMLAVGFLTEIKEIIALIPKNTQRMMFTATMNKKVTDVAKQLSSDPIDVSVSSGLASTKNIDQEYFLVDEKKKFKVLTNLLDTTNAKQIVVFGKTRRRVDELSVALNQCKYNSAGLQGDMSQRERTATMDRFKKLDIRILIATDVAARGIDVSNVELVVNFDLPDQVEYYTHRIGRTGRAGKKGRSVSFVRPEERAYIIHIENKTQSKILQSQPPTSEDVFEKNSENLIMKLSQALKESIINKNNEVVKKIASDFTAEELSIIIAQLNLSNSKINNITLKGEAPIKFKSGKVQRRIRSSGGRSRDGNWTQRRDKRNFSPSNSKRKRRVSQKDKKWK